MNENTQTTASPLQTYQAALALQAFLYGYPLVGMYELMHTQVLNPATQKTGFDEFAHTSALASPQTSFIPAPNNDTLYSRAWLDVRTEPVILRAPDTQGRYYSIQLLNLFSETLTNVGKRLTGTHSQTFAVVGPYWQGELPQDVKVIRSDTNFVLALLRVLVNGEADVVNARALQTQFRLASLARWQQGLDGAPQDTQTNWAPYKNANASEFFEMLRYALTLTPAI